MTPKKIFYAFLAGMIVSFIGSLPLGTLNVAAMQIGINESIKNAILFSLGSLAVEMIYVRVSLVGMDWVNKRKNLMVKLEWFSLLVVIILCIGSFYAAMHPSSNNGTKVFLDINRFGLGFFMSAINPVQIPFWFGWSAILFEKNILVKNNFAYNLYIIGIGLGTLMGNCVFIFGGKWMSSNITSLQKNINWIIGIIFLVTAILQLYKIIRKRKKIST